MQFMKMVVLPQRGCSAWTCIQYDFRAFVHVRIHMFVDKWGFQVPDRNVSLSNEWCHLAEGAIICVVAMPNVIFNRTSKGNIAHKQQTDLFYKREVKGSICRHNVSQRSVLGRNENVLDELNASFTPHHVNKDDNCCEERTASLERRAS